MVCAMPSFRRYQAVGGTSRFRVRSGALAGAPACFQIPTTCSQQPAGQQLSHLDLTATRRGAKERNARGVAGERATGSSMLCRVPGGIDRAGALIGPGVGGLVSSPLGVRERRSMQTPGGSRDHSTAAESSPSRQAAAGSPETLTVPWFDPG